MIDKDLKELIARDSRFRLDRLELDIWQRTAARHTAVRTSKVLASWQAAVVALAILGSATVGMTAATHVQTTNKSRLLGFGDELAPSTLLFGKRP